MLAVAQDDSLERPVVLFYHGLHTSKETHIKELEELAHRGALAVGVDFVGHGERAAAPDLGAFLALAPWPEQAFGVLLPTLEEIPWLVDFLWLEGYRKFSLVGISLGGMLAFAAPLVEPRLSSVVAILGCPDWSQLGQARPQARFLARSPHLSPEGFANVRLLAWNAKLDEHVPTWCIRNFMASLGRSCDYFEFPESGHFLRPQDWEAGWQRSLQWLGEAASR